MLAALANCAGCKHEAPAAPAPVTDTEPALVIAARRGNLVQVRAMLDNGAAINETGHRQATALIAAATEGHEDVVRLLLSRGADASRIGYRDRTASDWAMAQGYPEIARILRNAEETPSTGPTHAIRPPDYLPPMTGATTDPTLIIVPRSATEPTTKSTQPSTRPTTKRTSMPHTWPTSTPSRGAATE